MPNPRTTTHPRRALSALVALGLALAACGRTTPEAPAAAGAPAAVATGILKLRTVYDFTGDRGGTPYAGFDENGAYDYPEPVFGGWPLLIQRYGPPGTGFQGPPLTAFGLAERSPQDGLYLSLPVGRYRVTTLPPTATGGGVWAITGANVTQDGQTSPQGAVQAVDVEVRPGQAHEDASVVRFFRTCAAGGAVQPFQAGAFDDVTALTGPCAPEFRPDLSPNFNTGDTAAVPGGTFTIGELYLRNNGSGPARGTQTAGAAGYRLEASLWLSGPDGPTPENPPIPIKAIDVTPDVQPREDTLGIGRGKLLPSESFTVPAGTPEGIYMFCVRVDPDDAVAEADEANNFNCSSSVSVGAP